MDASQKDFLTEILNVGLGRAGNALSQMCHAHVSLAVPNLSLCDPAELPSRLDIFGQDEVLSVSQQFSGILSGDVILLLSTFSGQVITYRLFQGTREKDSLGSEIEPAVTELGNIVINHFIGSWSKMLCDRFRFGVPVYRRDTLANILPQAAEARRGDEWCAIYAETHMDIPDFFVMASLITLFDQTALQRLMGSFAGAE
jgi:chemotaxis protein CheC